MAFEETPHDGGSSSSDVWPETMDFSSLDNNVTGISDFFFATKEEIVTSGDINIKNSDNDRKDSMEEKMKWSSETLKWKGNSIYYLDSSVTVGGLNMHDYDDDRKESGEEKIKRLETLEQKCDHRYNFPMQERPKKIGLVIRIIFKMKHQNRRNGWKY
jgi:hypothetical protein